MAAAITRFLRDPDFRRRAVRFLLGRPTPLLTSDRTVLETVIFPYFQHLHEVKAVLFVGCDWYTRHYEHACFPGKDYWTLDPAPRARKFAGRRHVACALEALASHFPPERFDLIICNGVFGYGLDASEQCEQAFEQCRSRLRPGGYLIVGWDDTPAHTPVPMETIAKLREFERLEFPPLGSWRYVTDTPYRHTFDFYRRAAEHASASSRPLSVAVRLPAVGSDRGCVDALRALGRIEIHRLGETGSMPDPDLILDLTSRPAEPEQILRPRFGYWTFLYGETPERIAPGLLEILTGRRAAFVRLARLIPGGRATILWEGSVRTVTHSLSATRGRLLEAAGLWPARKLRELARCGAAPMGAEVELAARSRAARIGLRACLPAALLRNVGGRIRQELTRQRWRIGVIEQPIARAAATFDPAAIRWLDVPFTGFLADPFGLRAAGVGLVILAEAFQWNERRGRIVALVCRSDGTASITPTSLAFDTHVSYPQIIEHNGNIYCMPENCAQRRLQLFRAVDFPRRWVPDAVLLDDFAAVDAAVIRYQDRWWMFACDRADQDEAKLFVFHAAELHGPWSPHALNPVKCDLRSSRSGGTPFVAHDGALYRPAQDCSSTYGGALVINRVIRLTAEEFEEEVVARLEPDPGGPCPHGLHTLSDAGGVTLIDGKREELVPASVLAAMYRLPRWLFRTRI